MRRGPLELANAFQLDAHRVPAFAAAAFDDQKHKTCTCRWFQIETLYASQVRRQASDARLGLSPGKGQFDEHRGTDVPQLSVKTTVGV